MTDHKPLTGKEFNALRYEVDSSIVDHVQGAVSSAVALAKANLSTVLLSDAFKTVPTIKFVEALDSIDSAFPVFKDEEEV